MIRWDLVIVGIGQLAAREAPVPLGMQNIARAQMYLLQQLPHDEEPTFRGNSGIPLYWRWRDPDHQCITLYDSQGGKLQHFNKLNEQFRRELDGKHRRAPQTPHRNPLKASGAGHAGIPAGHSFFTYKGVPVIPDHASGPIEDAGIRAGEIIGRRAWLLDPEGLLRSVYMHQALWLPGRIMQGDDPDSHVIDWIGLSSDRHAGIHAFKDDVAGFLNVRDYVSAWRHRFFPVSRNLLGPDPAAERHPYKHCPFVTGKIAMWGKVIEHEHGYRAQYAAIHSLDNGPVEFLKSLVEKYNVSVIDDGV